MRFNALSSSASYRLFTVALLFIHSIQCASIAFYKRDGDNEDNDNQKSMKCPSDTLGGAGLYGDAHNCNRYYYCTAGNPVPSVQYCQTGTLFSTKLRRCVVAARVIDECS